MSHRSLKFAAWLAAVICILCSRKGAYAQESYFIDDGSQVSPVYHSDPETVTAETWEVRLYRKGQAPSGKNSWGILHGDSAAEVMAELRRCQAVEQRDEEVNGESVSRLTFKNYQGPIAVLKRAKSRPSRELLDAWDWFNGIKRVTAPFRDANPLTEGGNATGEYIDCLRNAAEQIATLEQRFDVLNPSLQLIDAGVADLKESLAKLDATGSGSDWHVGATGNNGERYTITGGSDHIHLDGSISSGGQTDRYVWEIDPATVQITLKNTQVTIAAANAGTGEPLNCELTIERKDGTIDHYRPRYYGLTLAFQKAPQAEQAYAAFTGQATASTLNTSDNSGAPPGQDPVPPPNGHYSLDELLKGSVYDAYNSYSKRRILRLAQQKFKDAGLYTSAVDGISGKGTQKAILEWQTQHQLNATGKLDGATLASLNLTNIAESSPPPPRIEAVPSTVESSPAYQSPDSSPDPVAEGLLEGLRNAAQILSAPPGQGFLR